MPNAAGESGCGGEGEGRGGGAGGWEAQVCGLWAAQAQPGPARPDAGEHPREAPSPALLGTPCADRVACDPDSQSAPSQVLTGQGRPAAWTPQTLPSSRFLQHRLPSYGCHPSPIPMVTAAAAGDVP